jgi:signal transduction histidine kinase
MTAWECAQRVPWVQVVLAFAAGAGTFWLAGVALAGLDSALIAVLLGVVFLVAVVATALVASVAYAIPVAMAGMLAYDWFYLPPTHPLEVPDSANLVDLLVYLAVAVLIGELAAHAIRRAERSDRARGAIAEEQAALRRVAMLVARGVPPHDVFAAVAREVGLLLGVDATHVARFDPHDTVTGVGSWSPDGTHLPVGTVRALDDTSVMGLVLRSGRPSRMEDYDNASGEIAAVARELKIRSSVGAPILVEGELWGVMVSSSRGDHLPDDTESRLLEFTELIATAISNAQARSDLAASRARIVAAADEERRRVVRDLHDGAQQRLVHTVVTLKLAQRALANGGEPPATLVSEALAEAERATGELRELAHGILPSVLTRGGLRAGLEALASRTPVPVDISVSPERFPAAVEATAYFVVAEALTNVAKHSQAARAEVVVCVEDGRLRLRVRDDGVGGVRPDGSGLLGLADRLAVLSGRLHVESPAEGGTLVAAAIPLSD